MRTVTGKTTAKPSVHQAASSQVFPAHPTASSVCETKRLRLPWSVVPVDGTPLGGSEPIDPIEFVRTIAAARIVFPTTMVRLSAGRESMSKELQALCFFAGANSIFVGSKLLTTPNPDEDDDAALFADLGLKAMTEEQARQH